MFKHIAHNFNPLSPSDPFSDACMFKPGGGCSRALLIPFERKSSEFQIFCAGFSHTQCLIISSVSYHLQVGLNVLIQRASRFSPTTRLLVQRFIPFPAVGKLNKNVKSQVSFSWDREGLSLGWTFKVNVIA